MNLNGFGILDRNDIYFFKGVFGGKWGKLFCWMKVSMGLNRDLGPWWTSIETR